MDSDELFRDMLTKKRKKRVSIPCKKAQDSYATRFLIFVGTGERKRFSFFVFELVDLKISVELCILVELWIVMALWTLMEHWIFAELCILVQLQFFEEHS